MKIGEYVWMSGLMVFVGIVFTVGYLFAQEQEAKALENIPGVKVPSPGTAAQYSTLKYGFIGTGVVIEIFFVFWIWRMTRVERAKYGLIKLVLSGKMTVEEAAKKLGVSREVVKDAVKELKREGVVE